MLVLHLPLLVAKLIFGVLFLAAAPALSLLLESVNGGLRWAARFRQADPNRMCTAELELKLRARFISV